jgi:hypothetical protein
MNRLRMLLMTTALIAGSSALASAETPGHDKDRDHNSTTYRNGGGYNNSGYYNGGYDRDNRGRADRDDTRYVDRDNRWRGDRDNRQWGNNHDNDDRRGSSRGWNGNRDRD